MKQNTTDVLIVLTIFIIAAIVMYGSYIKVQEDRAIPKPSVISFVLDNETIYCLTYEGSDYYTHTPCKYDNCWMTSDGQIIGSHRIGRNLMRAYRAATMLNKIERWRNKVEQE